MTDGVLSQFDLLHQFSLKIREIIGREPLLCRRIKVFRRACVYASGDRDAKIYYVERGRIKLELLTRDGRECVLAIRATGDIFGELCLSGRLTRVESAVAMEEAQLIAVPYLGLLKLLRGESLFENFVQYLVGCIAEMQEDIATLLTGNSEHRLAKVLLQLAEEVGTGGPCSTTLFVPRILYQDLAAMVGTTRSRVGFFLKQFQERGLVVVNEDHSLMLDAARLREFAAGKALTALADPDLQTDDEFSLASFPGDCQATD